MAGRKRKPQEPSTKLDERPLWEQIVELGKQIPEEELANIPPDLSENLDDYLYRGKLYRGKPWV